MIDFAWPAFAGNDGAADPAIRALIAQGDSVGLARALRGARLLASVVAVAEELDEAGADKSSHMAVVSMVAADGRRGLLAFTGLDSLHAWNPDARPVPCWGRDVGRAALDEGAVAVVVDVAGPGTMVLEGPALTVLCDHVDLPAVSDLVYEALAGLMKDHRMTAIAVDAREMALGVDVLVEIAIEADSTGRSPATVAAQAARALQSSADLRALVPGGIGIRLG